MLKLLQGSGFTEEDAKAAAVEVVKAPEKPRQWRMRAGVEGFEESGFELNPEWSADEESCLPLSRKCGGCGEEFIAQPFIAKGGKSASYSNHCPACEKERIPWMTPKMTIGAQPYFYPGSRPTDENFCGFLLKKPATTLIPLNAGMKNDLLTTAGPSGHAKHGPSSLHNKEVCPHWVNTPGSGPAADEGTMMHAKLQTGDRSGLNEEQLHAVDMVAGYFKALEDRLGDATVSFTERRVNVGGMTWGTADLILINGNQAIIADAKFGYIPVDDADTNLQGQAYTLGVWTDFPGVEEVTVAFAQPRRDEVSEHTFTRAADFERIKLRIEVVIARAEDPAAPYNPIPSNCTWCGAKGRCPALAGMALQLAAKAPDDVFVLPDEYTVTNITEPQMVGRGLLVAEVMEKWASDMKDHARSLAQDGMEIPGYELKDRKSPRKITNPAAAYLAVKDTVSAEAFMTAVGTVSIGELEKVFAVNAQRGMKGKSRSILDSLLTDADAIKQDGVIQYLSRVKTPLLAN